jgi:DNA-binding CsgD family transcriptional regulator
MERDKCEKCGAVLDPSESYDHAGRTFCEDCYLDQVATPKTCDPWAVYSAKKTSEQKAELTAVQQEILDLLRESGPLTAPDICVRLKIDERELQTNFATLRHMELARGFRKNGLIHYTLFNDRTS